MAGKIRAEYGLKAWWSAYVMRTEMKHLGGIVEQTYLPILRLVCDEADQVDRDWQQVKAARKQVRRWDSPHQRWRKTYGNFVRELEWAYAELKPRLSEPDFEHLVVTTMGERMDEWVGWMKPLLARLDRRTPGGLGAATKGPSAARMNARSMAMVAPIVGDVEVRGVDDGLIECYIPDCAMHTVVSREVPQTNACLYGCKAACEAFLGPDDPMSIHFEPNLPAFDCIMRVSMDGRPADPALRSSTKTDSDTRAGAAPEQPDRRVDEHASEEVPDGVGVSVPVP